MPQLVFEAQPVSVVLCQQLILCDVLCYNNNLQFFLHQCKMSASCFIASFSGEIWMSGLTKNQGASREKDGMEMVPECWLSQVGAQQNKEHM